MLVQANLSKNPTTVTFGIGKEFLWRDSGPAPIESFTNANKLRESFNRVLDNTSVLSKEKKATYVKNVEGMTLPQLKTYIYRIYKCGKKHKVKV